MATELKSKEGQDIMSWRPFRRLSDMDRFFDEVLGRPFGWPARLRRDELRAPAVEIVEEKDDLVVKAEIPGIKKEQLEINLSDHLLTIQGEKKEEEEVKKKGYYYSERVYGSFSRTIELPCDVKAEKAKASFKDGVLEVRLPKTEEAKQKEVKVKVE